MVRPEDSAPIFAFVLAVFAFALLLLIPPPPFRPVSGRTDWTCRRRRLRQDASFAAGVSECSDTQAPARADDEFTLPLPRPDAGCFLLRLRLARTGGCGRRRRMRNRNRCFVVGATASSSSGKPPEPRRSRPSLQRAPCPIDEHIGA
ncbi:hypothetical protein CDD83_821 [Cordyceps sp. RAO-2017]|nr:hypothetical protein CDD83_821 [Cordyceps sp. RAO-2017]